jgi:threonine dehydrogenase-like Zn-dependent dehydrogenase
VRGDGQAARRFGAERIIAVGHHAGRLEKARSFGATDVVSRHGEEAVQQILELTRGGARHVLECVGSASSMQQAIQVVRLGGSIGYVGVPHGPAAEGLDIMSLFFKNATFRGGPAPVRAYMQELMADVLEGALDPSPVFDLRVDLDGIPAGYEAMHERKALSAAEPQPNGRARATAPPRSFQQSAVSIQPRTVGPRAPQAMS